MSVIENLKYGNNAVSALKWGSADVGKLVVPNGDYWEATPITPSLSMRITGYDTGGRFFVSRALRDASPITISGAASTVVNLIGKNFGGVDITQGVHNCFVIDNYCICPTRYQGYNAWPGGDTSNTQRGISYTFKAANDSSISYNLNYESFVDESQNFLIRGNMVNKVIRVPNSGMTASTTVHSYPYSFDSGDFTTSPTLTLLRRTGSEEITAAVYKQRYYSGDDIELRLTDGNNSITDIFYYTIGRNNSSDYKDFIVVLGAGIRSKDNYYNSMFTYQNASAAYHFIQEPYQKNRIYYGKSFFPADFDDIYYNASDKSTSVYNFIFDTANSKVLTGSTFSLAAGSIKYICYPNSFDYTISYPTGYTILSNDYVYGDQHYTIIENNSATNPVTFTRV